MVLSIQAFINSAECMRPLHVMFTNVHLFCLVKRPRIDESVSLCICLLTVAWNREMQREIRCGGKQYFGYELYI